MITIADDGAVSDNAKDLYPTWRQIACGLCGGHGIVAVYHDGSPEECGDCYGSGYVWLSPSRTRLASWPGGPFVGSLTPQEAAAYTPNQSEQ